LQRVGLHAASEATVDVILQSQKHAAQCIFAQTSTAVSFLINWPFILKLCRVRSFWEISLLEQFIIAWMPYMSPSQRHLNAKLMHKRSC